MNYKFETLVEKLHYNVIKEVAKAAFNDTLSQAEETIPLILSPGPKATYRCCIHSERAIAKQRVANVTKTLNPGDAIIKVIPEACDQCPMGGYTVTNSCRGCIGHACVVACPKQAITVDSEHHAHIDKTKCINCGLCAKSCPFGAIYNFRRPCQKACHTGAITMDENLAAKIDKNKCVSCGACLQKCPFGAIVDRTQIVPIINELKKVLSDRENNRDEHEFYAVVAPSIASQFAPYTVEQVAEGLVSLGFTKVTEAALGADMVAWGESKELVEKQILTSSCCPAFVEYVLKFHPELKDKISHNLSPMAQIAKVIKERHPNAKVCFIGPCTAKKMEALKPAVSKYVDYVMTFSELRGLFGARDINVDQLQGITLDDATSYGRGFAKCGGLSSAVMQVLKEMDIKDFKLSPLSCDGMEQCIKALSNLAKGDSTYNFIEGMACEGGCVGGPSNLSHNTLRSKFLVDTHGKKSKKKTVKESIDPYNKQ